ncbi:sigma-70 family RNA polymerase sigma factor [Enterococcus sp. LJL99]
MEINLATLAIAGDKIALEQLLKQNYQQLYKTAYLYTKNETDALDIVQEAMIKIINKIDQLKYPEYFTTWSVRIVIFTSLDFIKKNQTTTFGWDEPMVEAEEVLSQEEKLDIYDAIKRLPKHLQEITILHYFYGKKVKEISLVMEEPLGTTKYKLYEARKKIKNYLEEEK